MSVDEYINGLGSPLEEIATELRRIVISFSPELKEDIKWNVPTYSINKNIFSIIAHKKHVNFQIMQGANIEDAHELDGTGKDMRHIKFFSLAAVDEKKLIRYIKQAVALDR